MESADFSSRSFLEDPYPVYRAIRECGEPRWIPHARESRPPGMWLFAGYQNVTEILRLAGPISKQITRIRPEGPPAPMDYAMLNRDPPDHKRLRAGLAPFLAPQRIMSMNGRIHEIVDALLDKMEGKESVDFITDFAVPLPVTIMAEILGIPSEDRDGLRETLAGASPGFDSATAGAEIQMQQKSAMEELVAYFNDLVKARRCEPRDDLVSGLVHLEAAGSLNDTELHDMCLLLWITGHETTVNLLGNGMLTLLRHPGELRRLRTDPSQVSPAVEEMLRFESPAQRSTFRVITSRCSVGGHEMEEGEQICALIAAANRDPAVFVEPNRFDIRRSPNPHLAFGLGIHNCPGAMLARTEARIAFTRLLERLPDPMLTGPPEWNPNTLFRGLRSLPIRFQPD